MRRTVALALLALACPRVEAPLDAPRVDVRDAAPDVTDARDVAALAPTLDEWDTGASGPCDRAGWCWEHPSPVGGSVAAVTAPREGRAWALTRDGVAVSITASGSRAQRLWDFDPSRASATVGVEGDALWVAAPGVLLRWDGAAVRSARFFDGLAEPTVAWSGAASELWLGGPSGLCLHHDGARWSARPVPTGADLVAFAGAGDDTLALDADGVAWRWREGRWRRGERRDPDAARSPWVVSRDEAWTCAAGAAWRWDGASWRRERVGVGGATFCRVWADAEGGAWWSDGAAVWRREEAARWVLEPGSTAVTAVAGRPGDVLVGRDDGALQRLREGAWEPAAPRFEVLRGDGDVQPVAITAYTILRRAGSAWREAAAPAGWGELAGLAVDAAGDAWIAGASTRGRGRAARVTSAGERDVLDADVTLRAVAAGAGGAWAVGDRGAAWRFEAGAWRRTDTGVTATLRDVRAVGDGAWAVGDDDVALRWAGGAWQRTPLPVGASLTRVHGRRADAVWALGRERASGRPVVLRWSGAQWARDMAGLPADYAPRDLTVTPSGEVWIAGVDARAAAEGAAALVRDGAVWRVVRVAAEATLACVWGARDGALRLGGSAGAVLVRRTP